jgi:hypothetical protein
LPKKSKGKRKLNRKEHKERKGKAKEEKNSFCSLVKKHPHQLSRLPILLSRTKIVDKSTNFVDDSPKVGYGVA